MWMIRFVGFLPDDNLSTETTPGRELRISSAETFKSVMLPVTLGW
jgi:hypothetical protein